MQPRRTTPWPAEALSSAHVPATFQFDIALREVMPFGDKLCAVALSLWWAH